MFSRALKGGAVRRSMSSVDWNLQADCEHPFTTEYWGRPSADPRPEVGDVSDEGRHNPKHWLWTPGRRFLLRIFVHTRCHQCGPCLKARARLWRHRIAYEMLNAPRTWFGSLTLNPVSLFRASVEAKKRDVDVLVVSGEEVTRYLKRVRKHATGKLRYVCVTETVSSGEREFHPHYHLLIHEQTRGAVLHRVLADQWTWGFERWRLVEPREQPEWYLTKYLLKENRDRVRASVLYGGRSVTGQPATLGDNET